MLKHLLLLGSVLFIGILASCGKPPAYDIVVKNTGKDKLTNVDVRFDKFYFNFGTLILDAQAGHGFVNEKHSLPEKATITWITSDEKKHTATVDVKSKMPNKYKHLEIYFSIDDTGNVSVTYKDKE